jgi:hypothetical protein
MSSFNAPDFSQRTLEVRHVNGEVAIYGSRHGLMRLVKLCEELIQRTPEGRNAHVHLEDYELLTSDSLPAVIAIFPS